MVIHTLAQEFDIYREVGGEPVPVTRDDSSNGFPRAQHGENPVSPTSRPEQGCLDAQTPFLVCGFCLLGRPLVPDWEKKGILGEGGLREEGPSICLIQASPWLATRGRPRPRPHLIHRPVSPQQAPAPRCTPSRAHRIASVSSPWTPRRCQPSPPPSLTFSSTHTGETHPGWISSPQLPPSFPDHLLPVTCFCRSVPLLYLGVLRTPVPLIDDQESSRYPLLASPPVIRATSKPCPHPPWYWGSTSLAHLGCVFCPTHSLWRSDPWTEKSNPETLLVLTRKEWIGVGVGLAALRASCLFLVSPKRQPQAGLGPAPSRSLPFPSSRATSLLSWTLRHRKSMCARGSGWARDPQPAHGGRGASGVWAAGLN